MAVLKILWHRQPLSAQAVLEQFDGESLSLSTVQSTLERLHRKDLVLREKPVRAYTYTANISQAELISRYLADISEHISDGDLAPMISGFMSFIGAENSDQLVNKLPQVKKPKKPS